MSKEQCPYCSIDNGTELFTCGGDDYDYFISVSIDKSKLHFEEFSWDGNFSEDLEISYCPKCGRKL